MLTLKLKAELDQKWEACWPVSQVKPLVFLDLLSYLLFIKKIEDRQFTLKKDIGSGSDTLIYFDETDELRWSRFKNMDAQSLYMIFTKDNGVLDFIKEYGSLNQQYSLYVREPLRLMPTAGLLFNTIGIIKIIERESPGISGNIFAYLLNKTEIVALNGQVSPPAYLVKLVIKMLRPKAGEMILDPAAGNGSLLINCLNDIAEKSPGTTNLTQSLSTQKYKGIEADPVQLRIAAMHMILHGIMEPVLEKLTISAQTNAQLSTTPVVVITNLIYKEIENGTINALSASKKNIYTGSEMEYLHFILNRLHPVRAAIIVPAFLLYDNGPEITTIRKKIIDDYNLDAVVTLPLKADSGFSGAAILLFSARASGTVAGSTWFYKMKIFHASAAKPATEKMVSTLAEKEQHEVEKIAELWAAGNNGNAQGKDGFFVEAEALVNNNYNLSFNQYIQFDSNKVDSHKTLNEPAEIKLKEESLDLQDQVSTESTGFLAEPLPKAEKTLPEKRIAVILILVVIGIAAIAFYSFYFKGVDRHKILPAIENNLLKDSTGEAVKTVDLSDTPSENLQKNASLIVLPKDSAGPAAQNNSDVPESLPQGSTAKYTVITKAYFYQQPDDRTRGKAYIDHWGNTVLLPLNEKNGFIYVVYTNQLGKTSRGWLDKKDLKPL